MSDDLKELLTIELTEQANRLPEPSLHLDAVHWRSRQRAVRRRTFAIGAYGFGAVAIVFAGVLLAARLDSPPDPSIVAGPPEAAELGQAAEPSDDKSPTETPSRTPTTDGTETTGDETSRTNPLTSTASRPPSDSNEDDRVTSASPSTAETSTTTSIEQPLASSAEAEADAAALGASPIPSSATSWEAEAADGSVWQQWDGTEACARRVTPSSGYSGEPICFDYIYEEGPWAVEEGSANESVAWYALNPVGKKRAVELVLSDGTVIPGVVEGELWMVVVDYAASGLPSTSRPELILLSTASGQQEIPVPSLVADAPGSTIVITAALVPG